MSVSVYAYQNHLALFRDLLARHRARDCSFSHRRLGRDLGFSSPSMLRNVLLGRCKLTPEAARRLCELFGLSLAERRYVCALVERDQTVDAARREMLDRRLLRLRLGRIARVKPSRYRLYDRWYHTALWAMLAYRPFDGNCDALGAALTPPVTGQQVRESIEMLVHLGMLRADRDGRLHPATPLITTGHAAPDCLRTYHLATIDLAKDAVDRFPRGVREVSTVTVALSGPAFTRVKGYLAECRRKVLAETARSGDCDRVYQLNLQAFPLALPAQKNRG